MIEAEMLEPIGQRRSLRIDKFKFMPRLQYQVGISLGADADPVKTGGRWLGAVGLDTNLKASPMERSYEGIVDLQQGLSACEDDIAIVYRTSPFDGDRVSQFVCLCKAAPSCAVHANKISIAESTD